MKISVKVQDLIKEFPVGDDTVRVLNGVDAHVNFGQLTMLVGPSGCGKTTLISVLSGILSPTSGTIMINDQLISGMKDRDKVLFRRQHVGFIFQQFNLLPALTASQNAALPLIAAGMSFNEAVLQANQTLSTIGMENHLEKLPRQLSGGQQQRVAIARALVHNPSLIVCDEPTASLDAKTGRGVMQILKDISIDQNRAVLVVTHDNRIYHFADRILEMSDGRIISDNEPENYIHRE